MQVHIAFIGGGNMAEAMVAALKRRGHPTANITVVDVNAARLRHLAHAYGVSVTESHEAAVSKADMVVLAVKPQQLAAAARQVRNAIRPDATILSIVAGVGTQKLRKLFPQGAIVRAMPNTPALVGEGMAVLFSNEEEAHRRKAEYVLEACGEVAWVDQEDALHAVTAVSGSGPAYFFFLAEVLEAVAKALGLDPELSARMVAQTALGAGRMLKESGRRAAELRHQVTSPGGTTQAALDVMFDRGMPEIIRMAVQAAEKRSRELG